MARKFKTEVRTAVNALHSRDEDEMVEALFEIIEALDPEIAELMHEDEEAAVAKINNEEAVDSEEDESIDPESLYG